jgi:MEMO1 family protein
VDTRRAAVAGRFYPSDPAELREQIEGFLRSATAPAGEPIPKAVIAPHAGTIYSGPIAASAYVRLAAGSSDVRRVVLLGPAHREWFRGVGVSSADAFATPLGDVLVDRSAIDDLLELDGVVVHDEAHRLEHSLEVHLPFLQVALGAFRLIPLVVGEASPELVGSVLEKLWGGAETVFVISSDLSHFHDYDTAMELDRETAGLIEEGALEALNGERACGYQPIRGMLKVARERGLGVSLVDLRSSGDTAGSRERVVGYGSFVVG